ncbi:TPA: P-type conjugative transfer protein VirB9, partial [Legionella pneumophila subsp. pneumophila]|nr:P-type conjugative transfer protein VirB9 [Legionella pneumophila subsp. pneumophila]
MKKILLSAAVLLLSQGTYAQNNPTSLSTDTRIKKVVYRENDVIPVHG